MLRRWLHVLHDDMYPTNQFSLALLHITGVLCTGHTFTIGFCFLGKEDEHSYSTAISWLRELVNGTESTIFITDKDSSLKNALYQNLPGVPHILCTWRAMNNIEKRAIKFFALKDAQTVDEQELVVEQRRSFLGRVTEVMRAYKTPDEFE
ncbi:hypothetical protein K3495_g1265 [Podosphaera aphanis]|nr:hypothetical protein K3495_g1265 [Podosphaera aphanis]